MHSSKKLPSVFTNMLTRAIALASATGLSLIGAANAASIVTFSDGLADPASTTVNAGDTFSFTLQLTTDIQTVGITYTLETLTGSLSSGQLRLTGRNTTGTTFSDLATSNGVALTAANALLDSVNNNDLGGGVADVFTPNPAGSLFLATYTVQALPSISPGTYTIRLSSSSVVASGTFPDFFDAPISNTATNIYTVTVVPEPTSTALMMVGLVSLAARRRRQAK